MDEEEEEEPENKPPPKRKAPSAPVARLGKKAATTASGSDGSDFIVDLISSGLRKVTVTVFKGKVQVDLREFYEVRGSQAEPASQDDLIHQLPVRVSWPGPSDRRGEAGSQGPGAVIRPMDDAQGSAARVARSCRQWRRRN